MCEDCGNEQTQMDMKYVNYKIGRVIDVELMVEPMKMCKVIVNDDTDDILEIVTIAKHVTKNDLVVVAL